MPPPCCRCNGSSSCKSLSLCQDRPSLYKLHSSRKNRCQNRQPSPPTAMLSPHCPSTHNVESVALLPLLSNKLEPELQDDADMSRAHDSHVYQTPNEHEPSTAHIPSLPPLLLQPLAWISCGQTVTAPALPTPYMQHMRRWSIGEGTISLYPQERLARNSVPS